MLHTAAVVLTAIVFAQLVIGAVMRHTQSGLAIHDFPLAFGRIIPAVDEASLRQINFDRMLAFLPTVTAEQVWIHFAHRAGALAVTLGVLWTAIVVFRGFRDRGELLIPALALIGLVLMQVFLGALTVWSHKQPHIATTHVAIGAATLATSLVLSIQSFRLARVSIPVTQPAQSAARQEPVRSTEAAT